MDLMELIKSRRSIRQFTSEPVPKELLYKIVQAAIWAPTGSNRQEIRFYITSNPAEIAAIHVAKPHIKNPQSAILVYADVTEEYYHNLSKRPHKAALPLLDVGAACQNMLLMAHNLGLGACWLNISPSLAEALAVFKRFVTPSTLRLTSALFLGYPARIPKLENFKHVGNQIQRKQLDYYLVDMPHISRVLYVHSIPRNAANLGSQALSVGMKKAIRNKLGNIPLGILDMSDVHLQHYINMFFKIEKMEPRQAWLIFRELIDRAKRAALRANMLPAYPFAGLIASCYQLQKRFSNIILKTEREQFSPPPIVKDPVFGLFPSFIMIPEKPYGCVMVDDEIRVPEPKQIYHLDKKVEDWLQRLHYKLPFFFAPSMPFRIACGYRLLNWAQVVILNGDGNITDSYPHLAIRGLFNLALAKSLGSSVYSVNQTVPVKNQTLCNLIRKVYNKIDGIIVREQISKQRLIEIGVKPVIITVGADCAVLVDDFNERRAKKIVEKYNIVNGSIGLILRGDMQPDLKYWSSAVQNIRDRFDKPVVFLSSCEETDFEFARELKNNTGVPFIEGLDDYSVFIPLLKHFSVIITQRYHPVYFSIISGVPFIPLLGNTFKTNGLLQHFDYPCPVLENPSLEELLYRLKTILSQSDQIRKNLKGIYQILLKRAYFNVQMLPSLQTSSTNNMDKNSNVLNKR